MHDSFDPLSYGAVADGHTKDTAAVQAAIDAAAWATAFLDSDFIWATDLHIENHRNYNGDGLDFDGCRHVWVRGCYIDGTDDNL